MNNQYDSVLTDDGSFTLKSVEFDESMHTSAGAFEESVIKYIQPTLYFNKAKRHLAVLDIGFGIGYNICALLYEWKKQKDKPFLTIISLEKDRSVLPYLTNLKFSDERDLIYEQVKKAFFAEHFEQEGFTINMRFGDARQSVVQLEKEKHLFDAIFQDAFSPGKNPELWSLEYFGVLKQLLRDDGVLSTYSSAPQVRRAMIEAGFRISKAQSTGKKKEGTLASVLAPLDYFSNDEISEIFDNYKSTVFRDFGLDQQRDCILKQRIEAMAESRKFHQSCQCR
jgi:tRNA U34 5-methylaminomethyl-2-thiouridine-forming methyltransferase MnmC